jgi:hypothetical protein
MIHTHITYGQLEIAFWIGVAAFAYFRVWRSYRRLRAVNKQVKQETKEREAA